MNRPGWTLSRWTAHPGFGVAALLLAGILLIVHGEPQPSSRPSGTSVVVSDTSPAPIVAEETLLVRDGHVEWRHATSRRAVPLPADTRPTELIRVRGAVVLLAVRAGRQRALLVDTALHVTDLGPADGVIPSEVGDAAFVIETAIGMPGTIGARPDARATPSVTPTSTPQPPDDNSLPTFIAHRYTSRGTQVGEGFILPPTTRLAVDTPFGVVVWHPIGRVFDKGVALEPSSAAAVLVRPDGTERALGAVHPLAASRTELLVWDVKDRRFGLMPLAWISSTATTTASPTASPSQTPPATPSGTASASPTPTPTEVAGTRWYARTQGIVVTGPAAFNENGSAYAVYAQVGSRRRLVVAVTSNLGVPVEVLALAQPTASETAVPSLSPSGPATGVPSATGSASPSDTSRQPQFAPEGFPISAPVTPVWWGDLAIGLASDGTVIGYRPNTGQANVIDLGVEGIESLA